MKKIQIAIIDSGLNYNHPAFINKNPILICEEEQYDPTKFYGHGTAIYNIISKVDDIADITNFKLDNIEDGICEDELIKVLKKIKKEYSFDLINLSLGISICERVDDLYSICKELTDLGTIIVSAFDNTGSMSFPAAFENVIGVTGSPSCVRIDEFQYISDNLVNLGAKGSIQRIAWNNPDYIMLGGNSFACAHTTVQIAKFMSEGIWGFDNIMNEFKRISKVKCVDQFNPSTITNVDYLPFTIKKAVLFPFNKEMHSLIRFSSTLDFEIVAIYDSKYSANVGATTSHIMKDDVISFTIQNIADIQWDMFDTLILGHLGEISQLINEQDLKYKLIFEAIKRNKNVYAFDDVSSIASSPNIYSPRIGKENLPPYRFGKLYRLSKPIIGVYGTSSRQGKFTLQLELRKQFQRLGYKVAQVGTEPSSLLYGIDCVYPMGYNNSVYIHDYDAIRYLNSIMQKLCRKDIDIIITGSQSGVVPFDTGNLAQYSLPQISFLLGTQPDAVVLCINPFDEFDYIKRTKNFIESSVDCKVIALVVFPMNIKDDWTGIYGSKKKLNNEEYYEIKKNLFANFHTPIYMLGCEEDMIQLSDTIVDYFAE